MGEPRALLAPYRLRAVQVGIRTTVLVLPVLLLLMVLPYHPGLITGSYAALVGVAALGCLAVAALPWRRLLQTSGGLRLLYAWSLVDMLLITAGVAVTGGGHSDLYLLFFITSVFFAASYPLRSQVVLFALTVALWLGAVAVSGQGIAAGNLVLRVVVLALVVMLSSFLSRELMAQMGSHAEATEAARRRAGMLATVAEHARSMSTLGPEHVLRSVADGAVALGLEVANLCLVDWATRSYEIRHGRGLPSGYEGSVHPLEVGVVGLALERGRTVVVDDYEAEPRATARMRAAGIRVAVAAPIVVEGVVAAVLVAGSRRPEPLEDGTVEAFELLAAQAGRALEVVGRFEQERAAVERLEELDRLKRDFLSSVSHELRTPLTAISGLGATLQARWEALGEDLKLELLERLNANARALDDIVSKLLDFSRLESGALAVDSATVELARPVEAVCGRLAELLAGHRVRVEIPSGLEVVCDPLLMERVLENLLTNAAKYTPPGTEVTVRAVAEGGHAVVVVSDRGPGIPPSEVARLGERFFRGGAPNERSVRGTGLGLALVREILELHGSRLEVRSALGEGSIFSFRLPLAPVRQEA